MFDLSPIDSSSSKSEHYALLAEQLEAVLHGEQNLIANAANMSALVFNNVADLNWSGFYLFDGSELVLGPFQGKVACVRIALDRGVCGAAASTAQTQVVPDVHEFPGHIACDAASRSEIVVPLFQGDRLIGVWDVDSPVPNRFDHEDQLGMERLCAIWLASLAK